MHDFAARRPSALAPVEAERGAHRRDARQRLAGGAVAGAREVQLAVQVDALRAVDHAPLAFELQPRQPRRHAGEGIHRQRLARGVDEVRFAGGSQGDVVGKAARKCAGLHARGAVFPLQCHVDVGALLLGRVGVAALERGGGDVHTVGIQLGVSGRTFGVGQVGAQLPLRRQIDEPADGRAVRAEPARCGRTELDLHRVGCVTGRVDPRAFGAAAGRELDVAESEFLEHETGRLYRLGAGHEGLFTQG